VSPLVSADGLGAWRAFLTAHARVVRLIEVELAESAALPYLWYDVLVAVAEAPGRELRMGDLARALLLTRSNSTRLVDKVEAAGLVRRESAASDGRGTVATLTPAGLRALRRAWPVYARGIRSHFLEHLSKAEMRLLREALGRIEAAASNRLRE
jgi:DNA-binding MarR family transcriptional regulator